MAKGDEEKIKPSQRKTVRDAESRRKRERMIEGLRRLPEIPVPRSGRSGMLAPPGFGFRSRPKSDEEFQGYLNKKIRDEIAPGAEGVYPGRIGDRFDTFMHGPMEPLPPSLRPQQRPAGMKKGGKVKKGYHRMPDGKIMKDSAHKKTAKCTRGDGCAKKGKTKGRMV